MAFGRVFIAQPERQKPLGPQFVQPLVDIPTNFAPIIRVQRLIHFKDSKAGPILQKGLAESQVFHGFFQPLVETPSIFRWVSSIIS